MSAHGGSMQIEFSLTFEEFSASLRAHRRRGQNNWAPKVGLWVTFVGGVAMLFGGVLLGAKPDWSALSLTALIAAALFASIYLTSGREFRRLWAGQPNLHLFQHCDISDTGIILDDGVCRCERKWAAFSRHLELPALFMVYTSQFSYVIIPKRAFPDAVAADQFAESLGRNIQPGTGGFPILLHGRETQNLNALGTGSDPG